MPFAPDSLATGIRGRLGMRKYTRGPGAVMLTMSVPVNWR
jgi:hypothetical protein